MEKLQKAAKDVVASVSTEDKRDSLSKAFEIFSYETVRLEKAYDSLNEQFQTLNLELQEANHKLHSKVAELDIMTDYLRSILDNIAQGILVVDLNGLSQHIIELPRPSSAFRPNRPSFIASGTTSPTASLASRCKRSCKNGSPPPTTP